LEEGFTASQRQGLELHPFVEAKILNDQQIRRIKNSLPTKSNVQKELVKSRRLKAVADETVEKSGLRAAVEVKSAVTDFPASKPVLDKDDGNASGQIQSNLSGRISNDDMSRVNQDTCVPDHQRSQANQAQSLGTASNTVAEKDNKESSKTSHSEIGEISKSSPRLTSSEAVVQDEVIPFTTEPHSVKSGEGSELKAKPVSDVAPPVCEPGNTSSAHSSESQPTTSSSHEQPERADTMPEISNVSERPPLISTRYKILTYDPSTEEMHITTTASKDTAKPVSAMAVHEALALLDHPAKFIPHIPKGFDVVTSKCNLLVLRESSTADAVSEILTSEQITNESDVKDEEWRRMRVNPIDGTTRLSPTGFSGMDPEFQEDYDDHDANEKRKYYETWRAENAEREKRTKASKEKCKNKKTYSSAGVVKTAIVAGATCYVAGVIGELLR
jgi:hypothetical protein